ncbi:MAG: hypothetical protein P8X57_13530, partial [Cyclobacteriaceae bacterium]
MRKIFLLLLVTLLVAQAADAQIRRSRRTTPEDESQTLNYARPQEYVIASIEVEGLRVLDKNALI